MASNTRAVAKSSGAEQQQMQRQTEASEKQVGGSASGGLNLNLGAAVSGMFGGKSKKTEEKNADGSSHSVEEKAGVGRVDGAGKANMAAFGQADAHAKDRHLKSSEQAQGQSKTKNVQTVDHLGIEGSK